MQAGIGSMTNPGQLIIALEPETAALFCMERKISKLETERASDLEDAKLAQPQTQYMVVDIGGDNQCCILLSSDSIIFLSQLKHVWDYRHYSLKVNCIGSLFFQNGKLRGKVSNRNLE